MFVRPEPLASLWLLLPGSMCGFGRGLKLGTVILEYSTDQLNWVALKNTHHPRVETSGLVSGQVYYFRFSALVGDEERAPCTAVKHIVRQSRLARKDTSVPSSASSPSRGSDSFLRFVRSLPHVGATSPSQPSRHPRKLPGAAQPWSRLPNVGCPLPSPNASSMGNRASTPAHEDAWLYARSSPFAPSSFTTSTWKSAARP